MSFSYYFNSINCQKVCDALSHQSLQCQLDKDKSICYHDIVVAYILSSLASNGQYELGLNVDNHSQINLAKDQVAVLSSLLGSLELETMEFMWQAGQATVRQVADSISCRRSIAYTTVMTVMGHLVDKGLLTRTMEKKRYRYRVALSRNEFLYQASQRMIRTLVNNFGDLAVAGFLSEISEIEPDRLDQLKRLARETRGETGVPE